MNGNRSEKYVKRSTDNDRVFFLLLVMDCGLMWKWNRELQSCETENIHGVQNSLCGLSTINLDSSVDS